MLHDIKEDEGWNSEIVPNLRPAAARNIQIAVGDKGLIAKSRGTIYVFMGASNCWGSLTDVETLKQLCDTADYRNVSVSIQAAAEPYFRMIQNNARRIGSIPVSICLGTRRYEIKLDGETIHLLECTGIVNSAPELDSRVSGFCHMPCMFKQIPSTWTRGPEDKQCRLYRYFRLLFPDVVEFKTILWILGSAAVDPAHMSKFLLLYGPTRTGKTGLVESISDILPGCTGVMDASQLMCKRGIPLHKDVARLMASNRVITTGELDFEGCDINTHRIKEMTGHDSVPIPPLRVATRCSIISSSNNLPDPEKQKDWLHDAIARRAVVVPMHVKADNLPRGERPDSEEDCIDMLLTCVYEFISNPYMPISIRCVLYSILGNWYAARLDVILLDENATMQQIMDVHAYIEHSLSMQPSTLGELAALRSPLCTVNYSGTPFIRNIRLGETSSTA